MAAGLVRAQDHGTRPTPTIGYLSFDAVNPKLPPSEFPSTKALEKLGWVDGKTIVIERRFANRDPGRLAALAQELTAKRVELIVAYTGAAAVAAARATRTIPIVFIGVPFPVEQELIKSFAKPGGNVTGTSVYFPGVGAKRLEFLRQLAPFAKQVSSTFGHEYIETVSGAQSKVLTSRLVSDGKTLGFEVQTQILREDKDINSFFANTITWAAHAILVGGGMITYNARHSIAKFAIEHQLPSLGSQSSYVDAGGLLSYGLSAAETNSLFARGMEHVDRILRGARPSELPVYQPDRYELSLNSKTARALGLAIPASILQRADRVIE